MNKKIAIIAWICVVFWMGVIFYLSHQPATQSAQLSSVIAQMIVDFIESAVPGLNMDMGGFNFYVRKCAHFTAYFILGVLTLMALMKSDAKKAFFSAVVICVLYATSDEIHQLFVLGRSCQLRDAFIDSAGALMGICIFIFTNKLMLTRRRIEKC